MEKILSKSPIIAILRHIPIGDTIAYMNSAVSCGITAFEVALNSENALKQIRMLRDTSPNILIGAGTCTTVEKCKQALDSGAQFFLSPAANADVLKYCSENNLPLLPGVMTPSDVELCVNHGYRFLKLFPAGDLPKGYIRSLKGPFDNTEYVAVGGVSPENMIDFFTCGFVGVGIGSNLFPKHFVQEQNWESATEYLNKYTKRGDLP